MPFAITLILLIIGMSIVWIVHIRRSIRLDKEYEQLQSDYQLALKNERIKFLIATISKMIEHEKIAYLDLEAMIQDIEMLGQQHIELKSLEDAVRKRKIKMENSVATIL